MVLANKDELAKTGAVAWSRDHNLGIKSEFFFHYCPEEPCFFIHDVMT